MRARLMIMVALLASACSSSVVIEAAPSQETAEALTEDAPAAAVLSDPTIYTDELGDWYVPAASVTDLVRPIEFGRTRDQVLMDINAAVPPEFDLSFEWQTLTIDEDHTVQALVPVQWEKRDDLYDYDSPDLDFFTDYELDTACQGFCIAQDWSLLMADPSASPFRTLVDNGIQVMVDQALTDPPGRLLVYDRTAVPNAGVAVTVEVVRWSNNADRFLICDAGLGGPDRSLWPTLADACLVATGDWLG